jgi:hypothetical protein
MGKFIVRGGPGVDFALLGNVNVHQAGHGLGVKFDITRTIGAIGTG